MKVTIQYPRGIFLALIGGAIGWGSILLAAAPVYAKWGKGKHTEPPPVVVAPMPSDASPFAIEMDPREMIARQYLAKTARRLRDDLKTYPQFTPQISQLADDIQGLAGLSVADPTYPERFAAFRASLKTLWALEGYDAI
jgi:hypothetical protein